MIVTQFISGEADTAAARYGMLVDAWRGMFAAALDQSHFGSPRQISELAAAAYTVATTFLSHEADRVADVSETVALEAQRVTLEQLSAASASDLYDDTGAHLSASEQHLSREITIQIERDIAFLLQSLRKTALSVTMSARAQALPTRVALAQYRVGPAPELKFFFHDRRGQKWPSRRFIRTVWRQHLLAVYNETVLMTLSEHGIETAEISHSDQKAPYHGMQLSLNAGSALPTYAELRDDVFHPNSEAILGRAAA